MTTTIQISDKRLTVIAKNNAFPKVADIMAARMLFEQDIDPQAPRYNSRVSFGRCPDVQS